MWRPKLNSFSLCLYVYLWCVAFSLVSSVLVADTISRSFEIRYVTQDPRANGETDFKGETAYLDTDQRITYLSQYAEYARHYFGDSELNTQIVPLAKASEVLETLKPQPQPAVRQRICLDRWQWTGHRDGLVRQRQEELKQWEILAGVSITEGCLVFNRDTSVTKAMPEQNWRCFLDWEVSSSGAGGSLFNLDGTAVVGFTEHGDLFYQTEGNTKEVRVSGETVVLRVDLDFVNRRYNLYANNSLITDFVPFADPSKEHFSQLTIAGKSGLRIGHVWGTGYQRLQESPNRPFSITTFVDEDFCLPPETTEWTAPGYDDSGWSTGNLPLAHGSQRYAGQDLLLRKQVNIEMLPQRALLYLESLTPGGEVFINGTSVSKIEDVYPREISVKDFLRVGQNLIAVKVNADKVNPKREMTHTHTDPYTGWFAGRMHLDLLPEAYIEDVFTWTEALSSRQAQQKVKVTLKYPEGAKGSYTLTSEIKSWFPSEGASVVENEWPFAIAEDTTQVLEKVISIESPQMWTPNRPFLYQLRLKLTDSQGRAIDDSVTTIGLRTVSQVGGTFRLNGDPEILRAPLIFGSRAPMDKIALWDRCPPTEYYVQEMLMARKMNANGLRLSFHDEQVGGINDPRIAELADQLGLMLIWQTAAWIRETSIANLDLAGMAACIREVRNHPSIVIWQPSNHPKWGNWDQAMTFYRKIHETITALDTSRLISPSADSRFLNPHDDTGTTDADGNPVEHCDPIWTAPLICRGNMDYVLGYGGQWTALRQWPRVEKANLPLYMPTTSYIPSFLASRDRAYFNFEHDETAAQPNWSVHRGKPTFQVPSYEWDYEKGSIGRRLPFEQWAVSQAWQAFAGYEVVRKQRWLDYDGFCWCCLRGGPNTGTYQKPLIDYYGQPKLAYYAMRMAFQDVLAGSRNVDTVYGPDDDIPLVILNLGQTKTVDLFIKARQLDGDEILEQVYENIKLDSGRTITTLPAWKPKLKGQGHYVFEYSVSVN